MAESRSFDADKCLLTLIGIGMITGETGQETSCSNPSSLGSCPVKATIAQRGDVDIDNGISCAIVENFKAKDFPRKDSPS